MTAWQTRLSILIFLAFYNSRTLRRSVFVSLKKMFFYSSVFLTLSMCSAGVLYWSKIVAVVYHVEPGVVCDFVCGDVNPIINLVELTSTFGSFRSSLIYAQKYKTMVPAAAV